MERVAYLGRYLKNMNAQYILMAPVCIRTIKILNLVRSKVSLRLMALNTNGLCLMIGGLVQATIDILFINIY